MSFTEVEPLPRTGCDFPFMQKPSAILDTAFDLYGFLPSDDDVRWPFIERYTATKEETGFKPINFENAWGAMYLSADQSYRSGFITTINPENSLQLNRALDNLGAVDPLLVRYKAAEDEEIDTRLVVTDRIATHAHDQPQEETPCPEALHQIRLYDNGYLARVGFNVHLEDPTTVFSIVNIQGVPGSQERLLDFQQRFGFSPFNLLVKKVISLAASWDSQTTVRGLINPARGNSRLYWGVLSTEEVEMYHAPQKATR